MSAAPSSNAARSWPRSRISARTSSVSLMLGTAVLVIVAVVLFAVLKGSELDNSDGAAANPGECIDRWNQNSHDFDAEIRAAFSVDVDYFVTAGTPVEFPNRCSILFMRESDCVAVQFLDHGDSVFELEVRKSLAGNTFAPDAFNAHVDHDTLDLEMGIEIFGQPMASSALDNVRCGVE